MACFVLIYRLQMIVDIIRPITVREVHATMTSMASRSGSEVMVKFRVWVKLTLEVKGWKKNQRWYFLYLLLTVIYLTFVALRYFWNRYFRLSCYVIISIRYLCYFSILHSFVRIADTSWLLLTLWSTHFSISLKSKNNIKFRLADILDVDGIKD